VGLVPGGVVLDGDALLYQLLRKGLVETITLKPDLEVDMIDRFPYVTFTGIGANSIDDGGAMPPSAWEWALEVSVFHTDLDEAKKVAEAIYDLVHSWNDPWGTAHIIADLGHAAEVTDRSLFTRVGEAELPGHTIQQLQGGFALQLHQA
jgi:hypothetical protein